MNRPTIGAPTKGCMTTRHEKVVNHYVILVASADSDSRETHFMDRRQCCVSCRTDRLQSQPNTIGHTAKKYGRYAAYSSPSDASTVHIYSIATAIDDDPFIIDPLNDRMA